MACLAECLKGHTNNAWKWDLLRQQAQDQGVLQAGMEGVTTHRDLQEVTDGCMAVPGDWY